MAQYPGLLVYVVGPSGVGKDSLLTFARRCLTRGEGQDDVHFVRRHITRPVEAGGEDHIALSEEEFSLCAQRGDFILAWQSHGLRYGVHRQVLALLEQGHVAVVNGSREYAQEAARRISPMLVVEIAAQREVLRSRLELRGREQGAELEERLTRAAQSLPRMPHHVRIDNSGDLETACRAFTEIIDNARHYAT
ncbi:MAG: phosphonate metabolism protein/1,5-bisphosphokinase (PRPP-forming) PhnN [Desulfovibrio sp.]|uniref:phosphonate metabolism protein/1,5-bisphosphokinase (PRPP-forming) PhnN n=1 Tax=Desulfovibrio sp. TaxID=885 RepID=UPI002A36F810|nr:phosphonate metabolism protein/1,5-bisphosphokinase (PRPP-forming) PhnN [Desulfovibrio sp.]MDY0259446.1 phosphonate metabolism protein/1,5-bisphosphokinase (PRPP-forming) PhnN [Desulfovibrio sp.]